METVRCWTKLDQSEAGGAVNHLQNVIRLITL